MKNKDFSIVGIDVDNATRFNLPFMLVLKKDTNLKNSLLKCMKELQIKSASLSAIGALKDPRLGFFNLEKKQYEHKQFSGIYELVSLSGNITQYENETIAHIHVVLGDENYKTIAGHLDDAFVGITVEMTVIPFEKNILRKKNPELNLPLIESQGQDLGGLNAKF